MELAILKLAGAAVLLLPFPDFLKEWAFAGFFIVLASALIAHLAIGDGLKKSMSPISVTVILALSYVIFRFWGTDDAGLANPDKRASSDRSIAGEKPTSRY